MVMKFVLLIKVHLKFVFMFTFLAGESTDAGEGNKRVQSTNRRVVRPVLALSYCWGGVDGGLAMCMFCFFFPKVSRFFFILAFIFFSSMIQLLHFYFYFLFFLLFDSK